MLERSTILTLCYVALVGTYYLYVLISRTGFTKIDAVVIAVSTLVVGLFLFTKKTNTVKELFEQLTAVAGVGSKVLPATLMDLNVDSYDVSRSIYDGTWNETFGDVGPVDYTSNLNLCYSAFSKKSRERLTTSPYTWANMSPNYLNNLPQGCTFDDSRIVMSSNPFQNYLNDGTGSVVQKIYSYGLPLGLNGVGVRGNGPKGMHMGINSSGATPQKFTMYMLLKFGDNVAEQKKCMILKSWANNKVNTGIVISADCMPDNGTSTYECAFNVTVGNHSKTFEVINVDKNDYYLLVLTYSKGGGEQYNAVLNVNRLTQLGEYVPVNIPEHTLTNEEIIDFTNKPIELGELSRGLHPVSISAFGVYNTDLPPAAKNKLAAYYATVLKKTSPFALGVYSTIIDLTKCPMGDVFCNKCDNIDWSNQLSVLSASKECQNTLHEYCVANPGAAICPCYETGKENDGICKSWRNMLQGGATCSASDLETYKKDNKLCPCATKPTGPLASDVNNAIVDFYKAEMNYIKSDTDAMAGSEPSFWEWLINK